MVLQLYCANWGYVFFTDDSFGVDGNPWDGLPSYFTELLEAAAKAPQSAAECGTFAPTPAPTAARTFAPLVSKKERSRGCFSWVLQVQLDSRQQAVRAC